MTRSSRVFLNDLNAKKAANVTSFLQKCRNVTQYFVDLLWARDEKPKSLLEKVDTDRAVKRFNITARLAQCCGKNASAIVRSARSNRGSRPNVRKPVVMLFSTLVTIESYIKKGFDWAIRLIGSGAPKLTIPCKSTRHINYLLLKGYRLVKSIRLGLHSGRLFVDFIFEKDDPPKRNDGCVVGMDSNYKAGLVFSDGQVIGGNLYGVIQTFSRRKKRTHAQIKNLLNRELKKLDFSSIGVLAIEDLRRVKQGKRGTFSRQLNRRLSHWLYAFIAKRLTELCGEYGVTLEAKDPFKTSQFCRFCRRWDRRNRSGDRFRCVVCGHEEHADHNSAVNLETLGLAGVYSLRLLPNLDCQSSR